MSSSHQLLEYALSNKAIMYFPAQAIDRTQDDGKEEQSLCVCVRERSCRMPE